MNEYEHGILIVHIFINIYNNNLIQLFYLKTNLIIKKKIMLGFGTCFPDNVHVSRNSFLFTIEEEKKIFIFLLLLPLPTLIKFKLKNVFINKKLNMYLNIVI